MPTSLQVLLCALGSLFAVSVFAQPPSWEEIDFLPESEFSMSNSGNIMYTSNNLGKMYLNGPVKYFDGSIFQYEQHLIEYDGSTWTPLLDFPEQDFGDIHHIEDYLDGIIFIREFEDEEGNRWIETVYFDGNTFESLGFLDIKNASFGAYVKNNEIHIASFFGEENEEVFDIFKYSNGAWSQAFNINPPIESGLITSLVHFDGDWYVGGRLLNGIQPSTENLYIFHDGEWSVVQDENGNGMLGIIRQIKKYEGKLVIAIERLAGIYNPAEGRGNGIIVWDGNSWSSLQTMTWLNGSTSSVAVHDIEIHDNDLYAIGTFYHIEEVPFRYLAKWNGSQWCGLQTQEWGEGGELVAMKIGLFEDQVIHFANPWGNLNRFFRHDGITYEPCTTPVGISEQAPEELLVYPNPVTNGLLNIPTETPFDRIQVINSWGQVVLRPEPRNQQIDVSHLPAGIYRLRMWQAEDQLANETTFVIQ